MSLLSLTILCSVLVVAGQSFACAVNYESNHSIKQSPCNSSNSFKTAGDASLLKDDQQFPKSNSAEPGNPQIQPPRKTPKLVQPRIHGISTPPPFHSPNSDLLYRPPGLNGQNSDLYYRGPGIENQNLHRNFGSSPLDKQGLTPQHFNPQQRLQYLFTLYYSPEYYRQQSQPRLYGGMGLPPQRDGSKTSPKSKRKTDF